MKVIIQRVSDALVRVDGNITGQIKNGILLLAGFEESDNKDDFEWINKKIVNLRIFNDDNGVMNLSCIDKDYNMLLVSQFTLYASTKKGNRPSYIKASEPNLAKQQYHTFHKILENEIKKTIPTGIFGADMKVSLTNDGPVTIIIDSKNKS
jgi:D-tyrosyl-tRNA(Tyr) deacylase